MDDWVEFVPISFCKLLKALNVWKRKLLNTIFGQYYIALHAFSRIIDLMSLKSRNRDQKKSMKKTECRFLIFSVSVCDNFIPPVSRLGNSDPSIIWNVPNCSQRHEACKVLAQSPEPVPRCSKIILKALVSSSIKRAMNRVSGSNSLEDIVV